MGIAVPQCGGGKEETTVKKFDRLFKIVLCVVAVVCVTMIILNTQSSGGRPRERNEDITHQYRLNEDSLRTLEDSIHFYEDGF